MKYKIFKGKLYLVDVGYYEAYGINYMDSISISDVSLEFSPINNFVAYLNKVDANINDIYFLIDKFLDNN